jgi:hypothetical protein
VTDTSTSDRFDIQRRALEPLYDATTLAAFEERAVVVATYLADHDMADNGSLVQPRSLNIVRSATTRTGDRVVVKASPANGGGEAHALKGWNNAGAPAAQVVDARRIDNTDLLVLKHVPGKTVAAADVLHLREPLTSTLHRLHNVKAPSLLPPLHGTDGHVARTVAWASEVLAAAGVAVDFQHLATDMPSDDVLIHGDCIPTNLMQTGRQLVAIDPIGVRGNPLWDWATFIGRGCHRFDPRQVLDEYGPALPSCDREFMYALVAFACCQLAAQEVFSGGVHHASPRQLLWRAEQLCPAALTPVDRGPGQVAVCRRDEATEKFAAFERAIVFTDHETDLAPTADAVMRIPVRDSPDLDVSWVPEVAALAPSRVLVACEYGQSRSTATALGLLVAWGWAPQAAFHALRRAQPQGRGFWPNVGIVAAFDELLNTGGALAAVCEQYQRIVSPYFNDRELR